MLPRTTDWFLKLVYHESAGVSHWSQSVNNRDLQFLKNAKKQVQEHMIATTGIRVDFPDPSCRTTTTGKVSRKLLHDAVVRGELLSNVPHHLRYNIAELCKRLSVILRIVSSKDKVNKLDEFKQYCQETYKLVLEKYSPPKCFLSPTVHKLLAHSWELIEKNSGVGLGTLSEGGLEASNKLLRRFRVNLSRKMIR